MVLKINSSGQNKLLNIKFALEMLRLWKETDPFHEIDYSMDEVYSEIANEV